MGKIRDNFLEVLYLTYPMLKREEVPMRSVVRMSRDNRGRIDLTVATFRGDHMYGRHFQNIGFNRAFLIGGKIDKADREGRCKISVDAGAPVGWEARFGFIQK